MRRRERLRSQQSNPQERNIRVKQLVRSAGLGAALTVLLATSAVAANPPGLRGYEGQPGNQGGNPANQGGQQGYEGQPGNQSGNQGANPGQAPGLRGYEGQPGNQGGDGKGHRGA